ncbi:hypothetical protein [Frankia tisae]|uniref:hypothetical protein n=1 Tax=Frankia tisae TaxID=2950104 RepID=UPI0021C1C6BB|nr:hypothetical protein [Frankia tisae]
MVGQRPDAARLVEAILASRAGSTTPPARIMVPAPAGWPGGAPMLPPSVARVAART